jgi:hypothetical protein
MRSERSRRTNQCKMKRGGEDDSFESIDALIKKTRDFARAKGLKASDVESAIRDMRKKRNESRNRVEHLKH